MKEKKISIVIASKNAVHDLHGCLKSIEAVDVGCSHEVIVSDNQSTDGTVQMIRKEFPQVLLCTSDRDLSYTATINRGIERAKGRYILLVDSDVVVLRESTQRLLGFMEKNPEAGAAISKMVYPDGSVQLVARRFPRPENALFGRESLLTRVFPGNRSSNQYLMLSELNQPDPFEIDWGSAAFMMVRRETLDAVGGMDEQYLMYWADADWCRRIKGAGWKIYCIPDAAVIHDMRNESTKKKSLFMIKAFHKGVYRYFRKFYSPSPVHPLNFVAVVGLTLRAAMELFRNGLKPSDEN